MLETFTQRLMPLKASLRGGAASRSACLRYADWHLLGMGHEPFRGHMACL